MYKSVFNVFYFEINYSILIYFSMNQAFNLLPRVFDIEVSVTISIIKV